VNRPRAGAGDAGTTLVELLVVMTVSVLMLTLTYGALITVQKQTVDNQARNQAVDDAQLGLQQIDRQVRSADQIFDPASAPLPMSLTILTRADAGTAGAFGTDRCVQWQVTSGGELRTRSWLATNTSTVTPWRILARDLKNDADTTPPFAYAASGPRTVDVDLVVKPEKSTGTPARVKSSLTARNTNTAGTTCSSPAA
jgi:hypothetical protein